MRAYLLHTLRGVSAWVISSRRHLVSPFSVCFLHHLGASLSSRPVPRPIFKVAVQSNFFFQVRAQRRANATEVFVLRSSAVCIHGRRVPPIVLASEDVVQDTPQPTHLSRALARARGEEKTGHRARDLVAV